MSDKDKNPKVNFKRRELRKVLPQYRMISDALDGQQAVKDAGKVYLPMPTSEAVACTLDDEKRYAAYLKRAVYYNVTRRTALGLTGQVFMRDPVLNVPEKLQPVVDDATGTGISLIQQMEKCLYTTLVFSRSGIMVDYPYTEEPSTQEDLEEGNIRPAVWVYRPEEIINWRTITRGVKEILSLVVLAEQYAYEDDGFEVKMARQYRVLRLDDSEEYIQQIWRKNSPIELKPSADKNELYGGSSTSIYSDFSHTGDWELHEEIKPTDHKGSPFNEIAFSFVGTENNDSAVDEPNFYDIASLNIAHYRNSADFEESCFMVGQPTLVVSGLTDTWVSEVLNDSVRIGARGGIPLPEGGSAELIQASENNLILAAMDQKERQMTALGAKLVESRKVERTAYETKVESSSEGSILGSTSLNVEKAFRWALDWCLLFIGDVSSEIELALNSDFDIAKLGPEDIRLALEVWEKKGTSWSELREVLRKVGLATEEDEDVKLEIEKVKKEELELQREQFAMKAESSNFGKEKEGKENGIKEKVND